MFRYRQLHEEEVFESKQSRAEYHEEQDTKLNSERFNKKDTRMNQRKRRGIKKSGSRLIRKDYTA